LHAISVRVVSIAIVEENDRSSTGGADNAIRDDVRAGPRRVPHAERPSDRALPLAPGDSGNPRIPLTVGRAEQRWFLRATLFDCVAAQRQISSNPTRRVPQQLLVVKSVICDDVSFVNHPEHETGPPISVPTEHEERRPHLGGA
jgi:hypothetical protein